MKGKVFDKRPHQIYNECAVSIRALYYNLEAPIQLISSVKYIIPYQEEMIALTNTLLADDYIPHHTTNVTILSLSCGLSYGLGENNLIDLGMASLFHWIGRPQKNEKLKIATSKEEYINSVNQLNKLEDISDRAKEIIINHHFLYR